MMQRKFLLSIAYATSIACFLSSCQSGEEKKSDTSAADTAVAVAKPVEPAPAPKPANVVVVKHKVANFAKWKSLYDSHDSVRLKYGLHNYIVARGTKDSNMVMIALRMDDVNKAKEFAALPDLKATMQKGGVKGPPSFMYIDMQMLDTTTNASPNRVMITHKVKDWDAWKKEFDSHKQVRMDAGLTDRAVGYEFGDNHMVTIVDVVSDMKKAEAFMNSKDLKDKMTAAGVEGPPTIFYYKVVQRY